MVRLAYKTHYKVATNYTAAYSCYHIEPLNDIIGTEPHINGTAQGEHDQYIIYIYGTTVTFHIYAALI